MISNFEIRFELEEFDLNETLPLGETIQGKMTVTPKETLQGVTVGYELVAEARGSMSTATQSIQKEYFAVEETFVAGESYTHPISFKNMAMESYKGKKVDFHIRLQPLFERPGEKKGFFKKLFEANPRKVATYLTFKNRRARYRITEEKLSLTDTSSSLAVIMVPLLVVLFILGVVGRQIFEIPFLYIGLFGLSILTLVILHQMAKRSILGKIELRCTHVDENNFRVTLQDPNLWGKIRNLKIWYEIKEKVVDDRGTSTRTYVKEIFESERKEVLHLTGTPQLVFPFPNGEPATQTFGDASIYWQIKLKATSSLGIPFTITAPIEVEKVLLPERI
ncbi:MAG: hypothetical protein AAGA10_22565 [Bacteroidota bacterium]